MNNTATSLNKAVYVNSAIKCQENYYEVSGVKDLSAAWRLVNFVCARTGWAASDIKTVKIINNEDV